MTYTNPTLNEIRTINGTRVQWDGTKWKNLTNGNHNLRIQELEDHAVLHYTLAEAQASDLAVGQCVVLTNYGDAYYEVVPSADIGGFYLPHPDTSIKLKYVLGMMQRPEHFGAIGDPNNITDEAAALTAFYAHAINGYLPKGKTFGSASTIPLESGTQIGGLGEVRQLSTSGNLLEATGKANIKLHGGKYKTNVTALGSGYTSNAVLFNGCEDVEARGVECEITEFSHGIKFVNTKGFGAIINKIYCESAFDPSIPDRQLPDGIAVLDGCQNGRVQRNTIKNIGQGINIQAIASSADITDIDASLNNIQDCAGYGVLSYSLNSDIYDVNICKNYIKRVYGTFYNTATGNYTHGAGIYLQAVDKHNVNFNTILDVCKNTDSESLSPAAISCAFRPSDGKGSNNQFFGNKINGSGYYGLLIDGNNNKVHGGYIQGTGKASFYSRSSKDLSVVDLSAFTVTGEIGMLFTSTAGGTGEHVNLSIIEPKVTGSKFPINLDGIKGATITKPKIYSSGVAGFLQGIGSTTNCEDVSVEEPLIEANGGFGIRYTGDRGRFVGGSLKGATQGQSLIVAINKGTYVEDVKIDNVGSTDAVLDIQADPATIITLPYLTKNIRLNLNSAGTINGLADVPLDSTVTIRVPSGTTLKNLNGVTGWRFRFADGTDRVTTRTSYFTFVPYFSGILDCTSEML